MKISFWKKKKKNSNIILDISRYLLFCLSKGKNKSVTENRSFKNLEFPIF